MAAEHEGHERAAEEISQLLYHAQVLMLAAGVLLDSGAKAEEELGLGFGQSRFRFAAPPGVLPTLQDLAGKRIATSYVGVVRRHLEEHGVEADVIRLDGAVETSIQLGVADVIADVVETGSTLKAAGLELFGEV